MQQSGATGIYSYIMLCVVKCPAKNHSALEDDRTPPEAGDIQRSSSLMLGIDEIGNHTTSCCLDFAVWSPC
jgi:hypothetical protein